jgi:hypothetical protein
MEQQLSVFSIVHKDYPMPKAEFIVPLQVNKQATKLQLGYASDDTGENIAERNATFCELTALYWIWKQLPNIQSSYIGLCHYRRYFIEKSAPSLTQKISALFHSKKKKETIDMPLGNEALQLASSLKAQAQMLHYLQEGNVVLPLKKDFRIRKDLVFTIKDQFVYTHLMEDWLTLEEAVKKTHPAYTQSLQFFHQQTSLHCYNMFVGSKAFVQGYCEWLFPVLFEIERNIQLSAYPYQRRVIGFMGERLLNLYIHHNNIPIATMPVMYLS